MCCHDGWVCRLGMPSLVAFQLAGARLILALACLLHVLVPLSAVAVGRCRSLHPRSSSGTKIGEASDCTICLSGSGATHIDG